MGLGLRDLAVLLACAAMLLLALTQEGDLHIEPAFFQPIEFHSARGGGATGGLMTTYANGVAPLENEIVPPPLITDLDGDGLNEVVLITREPKLKIFKLKPNVGNAAAHSFSTGGGGGVGKIDWDQLVLVREVGLLSSVMITSGRQAVGLAAGYIRPYSRRANRKQVIVVVNESWGIFVFNHKLRLMWTRSIEADLALRYLSEVAIMIDPHPMRRGSFAVSGSGGQQTRNDTGVIVVGGRLALKSALKKNVHGLHHETTPHDQSGPRPLEFPADYAEALQGRILRPGRKRGTVISDDGRDREEDHAEIIGADPLHFEREAHFSYYAFEGATGETRWRHDSTSFLEERHANELLRPQHEGVHSGEQDWRVFRKSLLDVALPHAWEKGVRASTKVVLAHVEKTRRGHQDQAIKRQRRTKSNFFLRDTPIGLRPHSDQEHVREPNALVVHLKDGIEVLHFYSGRPLCRLTLKAGSVHVDMDGDGVIDHVEAVGGVHAPRGRDAAGEHQPDMPKCLAMVRSGVPPTRQLFNASICQASWTDFMRGAGVDRRRRNGRHMSTAEGDGGVLGGGDPSTGRARASASGFSLEGGIGQADVSSLASPEEAMAGLFGRIGGSPIGMGGAAGASDQDQELRVAYPIVIQEPRTRGTTAKKRRYHSFFYLSNGLVSSFNHDGTRTWHTQTNAQWLRHQPDDAALTQAEQSFRPSLTPFPLLAEGGSSDHVLVVGERHVSLVTFGGHLRAEVLLARDLVVAPPVIGDFDSDGLSDFVLVTTKGFYGYRVQRRLAGQLFTVLVAGLLLLLGGIFAYKLSQATTLQQVAQYRAAFHQATRSKTTFTGGLRQLAVGGKSAKAQL